MTILSSPCELAKDNDIQMCASTLTENKGLCDGDSGGPVVSFLNGYPEQVGVISMKVGKCGSYGVDVITRVRPFRYWIKEITRKLCTRGIEIHFMIDFIGDCDIFIKNSENGNIVCPSHSCHVML